MYDLLNGIIEFLGYLSAMTIISRDSGMWLIDREATANYLEAFFMERGML